MRDLSSRLLDLRSEMTEKAASILDLKKDIITTKKGAGGKEEAQDRNEEPTKRLVKRMHSRQREYNLTLQIKLISVESERNKLTMKSKNQQEAVENLLAEHRALLSAHEMLKKDHALLRNTIEEEMSTHEKMKSDQMQEISTLQAKLKEDNADQDKIITQLEKKQAGHEKFLAEYNAFLCDHEALKKDLALLRNTYDDEKKLHVKLKTEHRKEMDALQIKLLSEEAERTKLAIKKTQIQEAHEDLLEANSTLVSDHESLRKKHASLRNTIDEDTKIHDELKAKQMEEISALQTKLKSEETERGKMATRLDKLKEERLDLEKSKKRLQKELSPYIESKFLQICGMAFT